MPTVSLLFVPNKLTPFQNALGLEILFQPVPKLPQQFPSSVSWGPVKSGREELRIEDADKDACFHTRFSTSESWPHSAGVILSPKVARGCKVPKRFSLEFSVLCPSVFPQVHALTSVPCTELPFPRTSLCLDHKLCDGRSLPPSPWHTPWRWHFVLHMVHAPYLRVKWKLASVCWSSSPLKPRTPHSRWMLSRVSHHS